MTPTKDEKIFSGRLISPLHKTLKIHVEWQLTQRGQAEKKETLNAINFSIILESVIFLESCLSEGLQRLSNNISSVRPDSELLERIEEKLIQESLRATGTQKYSQLFQVLVGITLPDLIQDEQLSRSFDVLYRLRNMFAHGRGLQLGITLPEYDPWEVEIEGSYLEIKRFLESIGIECENPRQPTLDDFLKNEVADWSWTTSKKILKAVISNLPKKEQIYFSFGLPDEFGIQNQPVPG